MKANDSFFFNLASAKRKISARLGLASWMKRQTCCIGRVQELSHQCWIPFLSQRCHHLHASLDGRRKSCDPRVPTATNVTFPIRIHEACVWPRVERCPHGSVIGLPPSLPHRFACTGRCRHARAPARDGAARGFRGPRLMTQDTSVRPWSMMPKGHWLLGGKDGACAHADIQI